MLLFEMEMQRRRVSSQQLDDVASAADGSGVLRNGGGETARPETDDRTAVSRPTGSSGDGGLLSGLAPLEPVDFLVSVDGGTRAEEPSLRRVEVTTRVEGNGVGHQGALAGPVMGAQQFISPQGVPMVFGPQVPQMMYPVPRGNVGFPMGGFEMPMGALDPLHGTRNPRNPAAWFGTPARPIEIGGNPFWSPDVRRAYGNGNEARSSGIRRVLDGDMNIAGEGVTGGTSVGVPNDPGMTQGELPFASGENGGNQNPQMVESRDPLSWFREPSMVQPPYAAPVVMDPVELFRIRCLREAEQRFNEGLEKMRVENGAPQDAPSFHTPSNHGDFPPGIPQEDVGHGQPLRNGEPRIEPPGKPVEKREPGGEGVSETLRSLELPKLSEGATALGFGDWLAIIEPMMADIGTNSMEWWKIVMDHVQKTYELWLAEGPLGRLRLTADIPVAAKGWPRTEKRATTMILQSLPDKLRTEMVSARRVTTPQIMFRLFCLLQPGGQAERANLLRLLTEFQLGNVVGEHAGSLRQWIRWLERGEELGVVLPDPMVLSAVLGKASDVVAKSGAQVGFRLATARQDLRLDHRPPLKDVKLFAEYVLAEAEEIGMANPSAGVSLGANQGNQGNQKPSVKSVGIMENPQRDSSKEGLEPRDQKGLLPVNSGNVSSKTPCRFWMSEDGCKKGDKCRYTHTVLDPKDNRCFLCSGVGHGKRDCPVGPKKKLAKTTPDKGPKRGEKGNGKGGNKSEPSQTSNWGSGEDGKDDLLKNPKGPEGHDGSDPKVDFGNLIQEASSLMKALRPSLKVVVLKNPKCCKSKAQDSSTGLLDGGATNALRVGTPEEIKEAEMVTVELAAGSVQLYQHRATGTLLSTKEVEPIVPLRGLIGLGYKITWDGSGCVIHHHSRGNLRCWLRNGCPVVKESHALQLIGEIEEMEKRKKQGPKLASGQLSRDVKDWWHERFPQVPEPVLQHMVGQNDGMPEGSNLPWNRHVRRRMAQSKAIVIHLFSGREPSYWKKGWPNGVEVLTLDKEVDSRQDLHNPYVWSYLVHLAKTKNILGIIGGPPCRSVSRLRHLSPGPRPVRGRGEKRFGLDELTNPELSLVHGDSALLLKQLALWELADENREDKKSLVGFVLESPEDPAAYDEKASEFPSFWDWEEVKQFQLRHDMNLISFDQGCLGHSQRKPTSCLGNMEGLEVLGGKRVEGKMGSPLKEDLSERFKQTASWSAWAPGLKETIKRSLLLLAIERGFGDLKLQKALDREGWRKHILQGHRPFRRDCRACILDMANGPQHRRRTHGGSSAWSMGIDVVQFTKTKDRVSGSDAKYAVVATALVPVFEPDHEDPPPEHTEDVIENEDWGEGLEEKDFPVEVEELSSENQGKDEKPKDLDSIPPKNGGVQGDGKDQERPQIDPAVLGCVKPLKLRHVTLVETVGSRQTSEVLTALSIILVKMRSMGICVRRLHGDRAKELLSHRIQTWCGRNGLLFTLGGGDDPANNGHVESEIGQLKKRLRLVLREAGQSVDQWPQALRYVAEERLRTQLKSFGLDRPQMIPYNASVVVKRKRWHDAGVLAPPYINATVLAPDPHMFDGWVVVTEEERVLHVREAVLPNPLGEQVALELREEKRENPQVEEVVRRRITGKQHPTEVPKLEFPSAESQGLCPSLGDISQDVDYEPSIAPLDEPPPEILSDLPLGSEVVGPKKLFGGETDNPRTDNPEKIVEMETEETEIRRIGVEVLEKTWGFVHRGLVEEIREVLKMVPDDEETGQWYGKTIGFLNQFKESVERGLKELEETKRRVHVSAIQMETETSGQTETEGKNLETETSEKPDDVLQTVTVGLSDVRKDIKSWIPAMREEYNSLVHTTQAVVPVDVNTLNADSVEFVPGKLVCVVKAGPNGGKRKCRGVICGNMMENDSSPIGVYASGADGTLIRTVVRDATLKKWGCTVTDIKTAFLLAPRIESPGQREVVVAPPKILVEGGICSPSERWKVLKALYGLPSSPACWAVYRNNTMRTFEWHDQDMDLRCYMEQTPEGNLWKIWGIGKGEEAVKRVLGHVLIYIDDMMVLGSDGIRKGFMKRLSQEWKCTPGETVNQEGWVRFSGFELKHGSDGVSIMVSQSSYIRDLLKRHDVKTEKPYPMPKWDTEEPPEEDITSAQIKEAQMYVGELLWAAVRSRPDIAFSVSIMGQQVTKRPRWVVQLGKHVLGYLLSTRDHCLHYRSEVGGYGPENTLQIPRHNDLIEAYSDISFAPNGNRSYQGVIVTFAGAPIQWESNRQAFCTMSTAESELVAALEAMTMSQSVEALLQVIHPETVFEKVLYGDNQSSLSILEKPDGPWRTRHLRLRANVFREKLQSQNQKWSVRHQKGSDLVADLLTKPIMPLASWKKFWRFMEFDTTLYDDKSRSNEAALYKDESRGVEAALYGDESRGVEAALYRDESRTVEAAIYQDELHGYEVKGDENGRIEACTEIKGKIAKVGMLLGVLGQVPFESVLGEEQSQQGKTFLMVVCVAVLSFLFVQLCRFESCPEILDRAKQFLSGSNLVSLCKASIGCDEEESKSKDKKKDTRKTKGKESKGKRTESRTLDWTKENELDPIKNQRNQIKRSFERERCSGEVLKNPNVLGKFGESLDLGISLNPSGKAKYGELVDGEAFVRGEGSNGTDTVDSSSTPNYCPTGCPLVPRNSIGAEAMDALKELQPKENVDEFGGNIRMKAISAVKPRRDETGNWEQGCEEPWNEERYLQKPGSSGKDCWVETLKSKGWLVRAHSELRVRTFHPLHKNVPVDPQALTGRRITISYDQEGGRLVTQDSWKTPARNLFEPKRLWTGWTFLEMMNAAPNNYGNKLPFDGDEAGGTRATGTPYPTEVSSSGSMGVEAAISEKSHGTGSRSYEKGSVKEKGKLVAQQLPKGPKGLQDTVKDDDGSEWSLITDFEKIG